MLFAQCYEITRLQVEDHLKKTITDFESLEEKKLYEAMNYSLLAGGKRLRPVLLLETAKIFQEDVTQYMPFAMALEMIHTYSLIHDDLPAMDDDDLRRGCPTNHKIFGEAIAILAGDALLNKAYEVLFQEVLRDPRDEKLRVAKLISSLSGSKGMIGGQTMDMEAQGKDIPLEILQKLDAKKTGALLKAAVLGGGILGGASKEELMALETYVESIGLAFQIKDDLLDVQGDTSTLGKTAGRDKVVGKSTYPKIFGIEKAQEMAEKSIEDGIKALDGLGKRNATFLVEMAHYIIQRNL